MSKGLCTVRIPMVCILLCSATPLSGQAYPSKPIRIITAEAGSDTDTLTRLIAEGLGSRMGQPIIVENRASNIRAEVAARALPDGYTLLHTGGNFYIATLLQKTSYDPEKDFSPVTMTVKDFNVLVVNSSVPASSVKELIALAKAKPGTLKYSAGTVGGGGHLAAELLKAMAGIDILRIPYKGGSGSLNAVLGGEVEMTFGSPTSLGPHIKTGKVRALGVTSAQPSTLASGLPPIGASLPGYEATGRTAMFAPAHTSATIIKRLSEEIVRVINQPEMKQKFFNSGVEAVGSSPEELGITMKAEMAKWGKLIRDTGIKVE